MRARKQIRLKRKEKGVALLISIFILLLISVVAIALIVSSGTESALAGNYRSSTGVYYAATAGLEEVRARLRPQSPISFKNTDSSFLPASGAPLAVCSPVYVINPLGAENVAPWDPANPYYDVQFSQEFGGICPAPLPPNPSPSTPSIWNRSPLNGLPFPGPLYKWVRLNGVSEQSLRLDVVPIDGTSNDAGPIYYDGARLNNDPNSGKQVLEVTALAVLPNGSQKLVQYIVATVPITLPPLLAALTLSDSPGNGATYNPPDNNNHFSVSGNDHDCSGNPVAGSALPAIGVLIGSDVTPIKSGIVQPSPAPSQYTGAGPAVDVEYLSSFPASLQSPSQLDAIAQTIIQNADAVVPAGSSSTQTAYLTSLGMSSSNLMTVVANGDLDVSSWSHIGYGLLLVTGTFTYDPDTTWNGIVLVIGKGRIVNSQNGQDKQINGVLFVAKTRDASGNLLPDPNLGGAYIHFLDIMGGYGIRYSSCWINKATPVGSYQILSFHEISQ